ncbi:MAG: right-handed parallel beta-helix repeat-containing protein [Bacteroidetes bacterium]|nr:right-handed parallel beta-helix repeat-containing protein [Bacteroidota bacterium]
MKKKISSYRNIASGAMILLLLLISCYRFDFVIQPFSAEINSSFEVDVSVTTDHGIGAGHEWLYFGIMLPDGWTVEDSIIFTYEANIGRLVYSDSVSQAMSLIDPALPDHYWWCARSTQETWWGSALNYRFTPVIHTDAQTGMFFLDYMVGDSSNGLNTQRSDDHLITVGLPEVVTVTTANDYCPGSLRDAIDRVGFYGTIDFNLSPGDTIFLQEELRIYKDISIIGPQNSPVVISGNHTHRVMFIEANRNTQLENLHLVHGISSAGGGLFCDVGSNTIFINLTIAHNTADIGGGLYCAYSNAIYDSIQRCNIYFNHAGWNGNDIYSDHYQDVFLDTFTVLNPTGFYAHPMENFEFDILQAQIELIDADLYVSPDGNDSNSGLTADEPFKTIRHAFSLVMADSLHQNTIYLLEGTYGPSSNGEIFPIIMRDYVSLNGVSEDSVILDAEGLSQVLIASNISASTVSELTITGGFFHQWNHAVHSEYSKLTIENATITNNLGGGIYSKGDGLSLVDVMITHNSVNLGGSPTYGRGAGLCIRDGSPELKNVVISNNVANCSGGGIDCSRGNPILENVTIAHNQSFQEGGGICAQESNFLFDSIHRSNIYLNTAMRGNDLYYYKLGWDTVTINVIVDTFSVMQPTPFHADPIEKFDFDILNVKIQQVNSDLYVSPEGNDENSGLTTDDPLKTIRHAMLKIRADSLHRNTIRLLEGTYGPSGNGEQLPLILPNYFSFSGTSASEVILDAEEQSSIFIIDHDDNVYISDMTLTGSNEGAIQSNGNPTLENIIISHNSGHGIGPSTIIGGGNQILRNVLISNNASTGIACKGIAAELTNVTITENEGEGIFCLNGSNIDMRNSIISNNAGGEIVFLGWNPSNYVHASYSDIHGYFTASGNGTIYLSTGTIQENPLFIGTGNHPYALSHESPCVDAGNPDTIAMQLPLWDLAGNQRIWDGNGNDTATIDMGAYEFGSMPVGISVCSTQYAVGSMLVWPNPTYGISDIRYSISEIRNVALTVYGVYGREIVVLVDEIQAAGEYVINFDASALPDGLYIIRLQAGDESAVTKVIVAR